QKINNSVYRLKMDDTYPGAPVFNIEHLKPYFKGNSDFEDRREYHVRWVGYGWEHDTWQTERDLRNAPERVAEYKLEHGL
ncbi:uncharacterized protein SCHCODRAFT_02479540, partial [Schizophyllum commune H4-8]|uniref:uncharacterized protein n=1 Tax=Schizophyllum commune (strain H4-8 / FGSC 9210) TaxID=578458 RepID=UPI00215E1236